MAWPYAVPAFFVLIILLTLAAIQAAHDDLRIVDSDDFRDALHTWAPVIAALPTLAVPREVKRFGNKARYFAMRLRKPPAPRGLVERVFGTGQVSPMSEVIPEPFIVALTAIHHVDPRLVQGALDGTFSISHDVAVATTIRAAWATMAASLGVPTAEHVRRFLALAGEYGSNDAF
jgi:hypothetical protein